MIQYTNSTFFPGQEWLYFKIYCNESISDRILTEAIVQFVSDVMNENKIKQWFFIRFNDPDSHIRLRLKITRMSTIGSLIYRLYKVLAQFISNKEVYKIELSTYVRETQRYHYPGIEFYEDFFFTDSKYVCSVLTNKPDDMKKILDSLIWMNTFITLRFSNLETCRDYAEKIATTYLAETGNHIENIHNINSEYRKLRNQVDNIVLKKADINIIETYSPNNIRSIPVDILSSAIHMHINRMFNHGSRQYELFLYQLLALAYKSCQYKLPTKN